MPYSSCMIVETSTLNPIESTAQRLAPFQIASLTIEVRLLVVAQRSTSSAIEVKPDLRSGVDMAQRCLLVWESKLGSWRGRWLAQAVGISFGRLRNGVVWVSCERLEVPAGKFLWFGSV